MTNKKALSTWIITVTLLAFIVFLSACRTATEPEPDPDPDPIEPEPIERVGTKEFTFNIIHRGTEADLTGYDIEIDGPVTASESGVSTAQFTLANVVSGEYTITVSLDGFVTAVITEELEVPTEESDDFYAETTISLREKTPPVAINNDEATTVQTGEPDEEDAEEEEAVSIEIPANTFPPDVVNADGTVDISVTRAKPSEATQSDDGLVSETIILTPAVELNNPVTITIPIRDIEGLDNLEYVLQPGNIPLNPDGNGNLVATITPDRSTSGVFSPVADLHILNRATISTFRIYEVTTPGLRLTSTDSFSAFIDLASQCGAALSHDYPIPGVTVPPAIRNFGAYNRFSQNRSVNVSVEGQAERVTTIRARNKTRTFTVVQGNNDLSTVTVNLAFVETTDPIRVACHDSGGT